MRTGIVRIGSKNDTLPAPVYKLFLKKIKNENQTLL